MIVKALSEAGHKYDLDQEIKRASLKLDANGSRRRAERTQALVEDLAATVFPLRIGAASITLSTSSLQLSAGGDGSSGLRVDGLIEPEVEFSMHHASPDIRDGITRYGSFEHVPKDIELIPLCSSGHEELMRGLIERLRAGRFNRLRKNPAKDDCGEG